MMPEAEQEPLQVVFQRRNQELDPQLVWRGKEEQDWSKLVVAVPPLYIQEKIHPKVLIDDLMCKIQHKRTRKGGGENQLGLFADFDGLPNENAKAEFYRHDQNWTNRMILGDSLQVMASLAEREGLRGQVQCIYLDPPYGIKFNSNFQWSTTSRDVKDGRIEHITREPEQVKAFRDTWRDGIHSYLTYLRDRLVIARDLLTESGSIFVQIGDENVHRVRCLLDEVFGEDNSLAAIAFKKKSFTTLGQAINDYILHYTKDRERAKLHNLYGTVTHQGQRPDKRDFRRILTIHQDLVNPKNEKEEKELLEQGGRWCTSADRVISQHRSTTRSGEISLRNQKIEPGSNAHWAFDPGCLLRLEKAGRLHLPDSGRLRAFVFWNDVPRNRITNFWDDTAGEPHPDYVVQTSTKVVERCVLMTTDPGDLVLDPTCGSGTLAHVAEKWGRRWVTIDTSRVALALARARIMGARYPFYLLSDSRDGQLKEAKITRRAPSEMPTHDNVRQGFVYQRAPHITLKAIADNSEIDVVWEEFQQVLEPLRKQLNQVLHQTWEEWEIPCRPEEHWPNDAKTILADWWKERIARQRQVDASIAAKASFEYLYDKPYQDNRKVRVAGPFTVESTSPHRILVVDEGKGTAEETTEPKDWFGDYNDFVQIILDNLKTAGVQQSHKNDKINFLSIVPWPGRRLCAEGVFGEGSDEQGLEQRAAIFVGPEFGTVSRADLVSAAREAAEGDFDVLISCAFNYDAHSNELDRLGRIPILQARMNADLHMADEFRKTNRGNLFVVFGEPDIDLLDDEEGKVRIRVNGVDVFHPNTGEIRSDGPEGIACWFIDTDYNEESFFVRHAYFLGAGDPYKSLKTSLKAEIDAEAWKLLNSDISRPFDKPQSGRVAVKVINHLGDEVMRVFDVN